MINKKAMSTVVTTVILVALVLIVLGVIWAIISGLIGEQSSSIDLRSRCLEISVAPIAASCAGTECSVTVRRAAGGGNFDGLKFVFYGADGSSNVVNEITTVQPLATSVVSGLIHGVTTPEKVDVAVYILDAANSEHICPQTASRNI